jgi:hypothetical protein
VDWCPRSSWPSPNRCRGNWSRAPPSSSNLAGTPEPIDSNTEHSRSTLTTHLRSVPSRKFTSPSPAPRRRLAAFSIAWIRPNIQAIRGLASRRLGHRVLKGGITIEARQHARAALAAVKVAVTDDAFAHIAAQLPPDYTDLLGTEPVQHR